jgi:hypothetical protein
MLTVVMISWMIVFMSLGMVNFYYGRGLKWKFTWGHLLWFVIGIIFVVIPYEAILITISK